MGSYNDMRDAVAKHNVANDHEEWDWETAMCKMMPPGICMYENGADPFGINCQMDLGTAAAGTVAIAELTARYALGMEYLVEQEEAERRAAICSGCQWNISMAGCQTCGAGDVVRAAVSRIIGDKTTSADQYLGGCCGCHCSLKSIVWVKGSILKKGFTDDLREKTERLQPHCFKLQL
jgi:hypothetical protein